ncbi:MAG TPA: hypothetical protein DEH78_02990 [Solibacterales bacterium]|nr:hypothetical protein [Bryobacterales bacterium]
MHKRTLLVVLAGLLLAGIASPADKPDFSGEWKLNLSKSDYGPVPAPDMMVRKVAHKEPELTVTTTQKGQMGEFTTEAKYATDGKEYVNKTRRGEAKSVLKWEGAALVITTKLDFQGNEIVTVDRWTLAEDGKTLNGDMKLSSPMGEAEMKMVFEKQ